MKKLLTLLTLSGAFAAQAQHYARLDSTFHGNGYHVFDTSMQTLPQVNAKHTLQADGKIVLCGNRINGFFASDVTVTRIKPNGNLDSSFASNGVASFAIAPGGLNMAIGVVVQADGKIVTAGTTTDGFNPGNLFVARLSSNGTLDPTFGTAGIAQFDINDETERVTDVKIQPDGKILVCGIASTSSSADSSFVLRVGTTGAADNSFAQNGVFRYQHNGEMTDFYSVDTATGGKIVVGGSYNSPNDYQDFLLLRLNSNGTLDNTFNAGGTFTNDYFNDYDEIHSLKTMADGSILAAGYSYNGNNDGVAAIRVSAGGSLVSTFGTGGRVYVGDPNQPMRGYALAMQADGKAVIGGYMPDTNFYYNFLLMRLTTAGQPDTSFSPGTGYVTTDFYGFDDALGSLCIQPDGRILAYGTSISDALSFDVEPMLARYVTVVTNTPPQATRNVAHPAQLYVYPQPASGNTLQLGGAAATAGYCYRLLNTAGQLQLESSLRENQSSIDLPASLPNGQYYLLLQHGANSPLLHHKVQVLRGR